MILSAALVVGYSYDRRFAAEFETGESVSLVVYRCEETLENAERLIQAFKSKKLHLGGPLKQEGLYVTSNWHGWASGMAVVMKLKVKLANPYVTDVPLEIYKRSTARRKGFDSIVSQPTTGIDEEQILLFNPDRQVQSVQYYKRLK